MAELTEERIREIIREEIVRVVQEMRVEGGMEGGGVSSLLSTLVPRRGTALYRWAKEKGLPVEPPTYRELALMDGDPEPDE